MKLKRYLFVMACAFMLLISATAYAQPQPPVLSVTNGSWVYLSWTEVAGATGYTLSYAPLPYTGTASIVVVDMGTQKSLSGELPAGVAFYAVVQSRDNTGSSQYSNVVSVIGGSYPTDIIARAAKLPAKDMSQSLLYNNLLEWEKAVVSKMVQAAAYMDAAYWQQVDPEGEKLWRSLASASTSLEKAVYTMLDANYGRWDRFLNFASFVGAIERPTGGYVYPADLTKSELDAYIAANPMEKDALLNPFTVVRRSGEKLMTIPYHQEYAAFVDPTALLLFEAAELSQNPTLTKYLRLQAQALRSDNYYEANIAWLDLNCNIDVSIGPHEIYDDQLTGQKTFYKTNVLLVDQSAAAQLAKYKSTGPALQENLPVDPKYKPVYKADTMMPLLLADDIRRSGQGRAIMEPVAFSLPNDPKVWAAKGSKKVMMGNYLTTRRTVVLEPLAQVILDQSVSAMIDHEAYFTWVLMHEVCHTLGPREVVKGGQTLTPREALGEYYSPIEEGKADIGGLYNIPYLISHGLVTAPLEWHYAGFMAESLRSIRFGMGSPYGVIRSAAWNIFLDKGALVYDSASNRFNMDVPKMTAAIRELLITLITIEGDGDTTAAVNLINTYSNIRPELKKLLDAAENSVPLEFVPVYEK